MRDRSPAIEIAQHEIHPSGCSSLALKYEAAIDYGCGSLGQDLDPPLGLVAVIRHCRNISQTIEIEVASDPRSETHPPNE
jgi:hypothetical protein